MTAVPKALCPFCRRNIPVVTHAHGLKLQPSYPTHGPGINGFFCQGSGKTVSAEHVGRFESRGQR